MLPERTGETPPQAADRLPLFDREQLFEPAHPRVLLRIHPCLPELLDVLVRDLEPEQCVNRSTNELDEGRLRQDCLLKPLLRAGLLQVSAACDPLKLGEDGEEFQLGFAEHRLGGEPASMIDYAELDPVAEAGALGLQPFRS